MHEKIDVIYILNFNRSVARVNNIRLISNFAQKFFFHNMIILGGETEKVPTSPK